MHGLIPLLVFAAGALTSPVEPEKRAIVTLLTTVVDIDIADTVYVTATPAADTPVVLFATSTPDAYQLPAESTTHYRHRHVPKLGSPNPAIQSPAEPTLTPINTPDVIQFKAQSYTTSDLVNSETDTKAVPAPASSKSVAIVASKTVAAEVQFQPPTTFVPNLDTTSYVYKALVLQHHNIHRRNHSAPDLTWSDQLAQYAETTAKTCKWGHSSAPGGGGYGQNIAAGVQTGNISAILTNDFYNNELPYYPQFGISNPDMTNFEKWGHLSQFVWSATTSVGCYTEICSPPGANALDCKPDGSSYLSGLNCGNGGIPAIFTVCNYHPAGNYAGQYLNVHAPLGEPTVYVNGNGVQGL